MTGLLEIFLDPGLRRDDDGKVVGNRTVFSWIPACAGVMMERLSAIAPSFPGSRPAPG
jgi:hypothetical protein